MNRKVESPSPLVRTLGYLTLVIFAAGCSTMHTIPLSDGESLQSSVSVGQRVEVTDIHGNVSKFRVENVSESEISGEGHAVVLSDLQRLRVIESSGTMNDKTVLWILLAVAVVGVATGELQPQDSPLK